MKNYEQPTFVILTISTDDIIRTSIGFTDSGEGDSVSIKDLFNIGG